MIGRRPGRTLKTADIKRHGIHAITGLFILAVFYTLYFARDFFSVFRDVEELIMAILDYIDHHNRAPKPFIWTAKATDILEKVKRARKALDNRHPA